MKFTLELLNHGKSRKGSWIRALLFALDLSTISKG